MTPLNAAATSAGIFRHSSSLSTARRRAPRRGCPGPPYEHVDTGQNSLGRSTPIGLPEAHGLPSSWKYPHFLAKLSEVEDFPSQRGTRSRSLALAAIAAIRRWANSFASLRTQRLHDEARSRGQANGLIEVRLRDMCTHPRQAMAAHMPPCCAAHRFWLSDRAIPALYTETAPYTTCHGHVGTCSCKGNTRIPSRSSIDGICRHGARATQLLNAKRRLL